MLAACDCLTPGCLSSCLLCHIVSICGHTSPSLCALLGFPRGVWPGASVYVRLLSSYRQCQDLRVGVSESGRLILCPSLCLSECLVPTELTGLSDNRNQNSSCCCVTCCVKHLRDISVGSLFTEAAARALRGEITSPKTHS